MTAPMQSGQKPLLSAQLSQDQDIHFGVAWNSRWQEFLTSLHDFLAGPHPLSDDEVLQVPALRVEWISGELPGRAFLASSLWHIAAVLILILPIWGFLPKVEPRLPPMQIELTYVPAQDLPRISLPSRLPNPPRAAKPAQAAEKSQQRGADAYHPRQTIVSIPVRVTHPRQTLIRPTAPPLPPKAVPLLPNIVEWAAAAPAKPQFELSPAATPRVRQRARQDVAAPEVDNLVKNPGPINVAPMPVVDQHPQMPLSPMSAALPERRQTHSGPAAAPEIGPIDSADDASVRRLIALSATPGPPAPEVTVPDGNLAARIAISPEGRTPGTPGAIDRASGAGGAGPGIPTAGASSAAGVTSNANGLPAAVSVSGGIAPTGSPSGKLNLRPPPVAATTPRKRPTSIAAIDPNLPPEKVLLGDDVHTLDVNMPNLTSVTGSWVLYFSQLDEGNEPSYKLKGELGGPVAVEKMDPKYPPELVKGHVDGEVVLYAIIRKDGSVDSIQVVHSIDPQLDRNAVEALARWKFRPATRDGAPVDLEAVVHIPFRFRSPQ